MNLVGLILEVHHRLGSAGLPHAFGGALAFGLIADPRGTVDIDVNVFVDELGAVDEALAVLGFTPGTTDIGIGGVRYESPGLLFPIDVFPNLDDRYTEIEARVVHHEFGPASAQLPFLSALDLSVFKLSFGRPKDWVDLAGIAGARPDLDVDAVEELLVALRGPTMYPRVARFRRLFT